MRVWYAIAGVCLIVMALVLAPAIARAQMQEEPQNPFIPKRSHVSFYGTGAAQFTPKPKAGIMATPLPTCKPMQSRVGFKVECLSDSSVKSSTTCRGSMSFYGFNLTRTVSGTISGTPETSFMVVVTSPDGLIQGCTLGNQPPTQPGTANVVTMPGCTLTVQPDCSGDAVGAGAGHTLTSSAAVTVTPSE
jgi:hypothetical protein